MINFFKLGFYHTVLVVVLYAIHKLLEERFDKYFILSVLVWFCTWMTVIIWMEAYFW